MNTNEVRQLLNEVSQHNVVMEVNGERGEYLNAETNTEFLDRVWNTVFQMLDEHPGIGAYQVCSRANA